MNSLLEDATRLHYEAWELASRKRDFEIELKVQGDETGMVYIGRLLGRSQSYDQKLVLSSILERRKKQTLR